METSASAKHFSEEAPIYILLLTHNLFKTKFGLINGSSERFVLAIFLQKILLYVSLSRLLLNINYAPIILSVFLDSSGSTVGFSQNSAEKWRA